MRQSRCIIEITKGISAECSSGQCTSRDLQCKTSGIVSTIAACPALGNSCVLSCEDRSRTCYQLNGFFRDGTACGGIGKCLKGNCEGATIFSMAKVLLDAYPLYGYPLLIIASLFILTTVYAWCRSCCCPKKRQQPATQGRPRGQPLEGPTQHNGVGQVPPNDWRNNNRRRQP
jgi:hypothetical protein